MTIKEFEKTAFSAKSKVRYKGEIYDVVSVDFEEGLIAIDNGKDDDGIFDWPTLEWKRFENCEIVNS